MRVLFVCLGNICRSPTAEGVLRHQLEAAGLADQVQVASAGTGDWHVGKAPDSRTCKAALARGYDLSRQRAQQIKAAHFAEYDLVLAMDKSNLGNLQALRPQCLDPLHARASLAPEHQHHLHAGGALRGLAQVNGHLGGA